MLKLNIISGSFCSCCCSFAFAFLEPLNVFVRQKPLRLNRGTIINPLLRNMLCWHTPSHTHQVCVCEGVEGCWKCPLIDLLLCCINTWNWVKLASFSPFPLLFFGLVLISSLSLFQGQRSRQKFGRSISPLDWHFCGSSAPDK